MEKIFTHNFCGLALNLIQSGKNAKFMPLKNIMTSTDTVYRKMHVYFMKVGVQKINNTKVTLCICCKRMINTKVTLCLCCKRMITICPNKNIYINITFTFIISALKSNIIPLSSCWRHQISTDPQGQRHFLFLRHNWHTTIAVSFPPSQATY